MATVNDFEAFRIAQATNLSRAFIQSEHYPDSVAQEILRRLDAGEPVGPVPDDILVLSSDLAYGRARGQGVLNTAVEFWRPVIERVAAGNAETYAFLVRVVKISTIVGIIYVGSVIYRNIK